MITKTQFENIVNTEKYSNSIFGNIRNYDEFENYLKTSLGGDNLAEFVSTLSRLVKKIKADTLIEDKDISSFLNSTPSMEVIKILNLKYNKDVILGREELIEDMLGDDIKSFEKKLDILIELDELTDNYVQPSYKKVILKKRDANKTGKYLGILGIFIILIFIGLYGYCYSNVNNENSRIDILYSKINNNISKYEQKIIDTNKKKEENLKKISYYRNKIERLKKLKNTYRKYDYSIEEFIYCPFNKLDNSKKLEEAISRELVDK